MKKFINLINETINESLKDKKQFYLEIRDDFLGAIIEDYIDSNVDDIKDKEEIEAAFKKGPFKVKSIDIYEDHYKLEENITSIVLEIKLKDALEEIGKLDSKYAKDFDINDKEFKTVFNSNHLLDNILDNVYDTDIVSNVNIKGNKLEITFDIVNVDEE